MEPTYQMQKISTQLCYESLLKIYQAFSGEIVLDKLLKKMMHILIEYTGAERGLLLLDKGQGKMDTEKWEVEWVIEAEVAINQNQVTVLQSLPIGGRLSTTIVNDVATSCEPVVLANTSQAGIYTNDSYIRQAQIKSVLCTPLLYQAQLIGLLYLENHLNEGAFTPALLESIKILSSQAVLSLKNALLYRRLEQKLQERTTQLTQANQEIAQVNQEMTLLLKALSSKTCLSLDNARLANTLEQQVQERTAQLVQANQEMSKENLEMTYFNKRLKAENLRMSAELDITRRLQKMVLPSEAELQQIKELDIAGFMAPANEVGGDYYDVLMLQERVFISIGDVSGHGLESGVLMLMVQTAVRSLLDSGITDCRQFLNILNRTIYNNVQRIKTDKNLTLSLLDYQPLTSPSGVTGILHLAGQHEEVLVVRQGGKIERIDTLDLGFMVGVKNDISPFVSQLEISLQPGDGIVLYTDGITEARNVEKEFYGLERLCEVVSRHWHSCAHEIQKAAIADVRQYIGEQEVDDDITLLILKQKFLTDRISEQ
jgi:serine phosphatase RsbU (regulator of sigma subunit)